MVFETMDPPGRYFKVKIYDQKLKELMESTHKGYNSTDTKFFFVPRAYIPVTGRNIYFIIIELVVLYNQFFFIAENILIKFEANEPYKSYNSSIKNVILDKNTKVMIIKNPEPPKDTTDEQISFEVDKFIIGEPKPLSDYNFF